MTQPKPTREIGFQEAMQRAAKAKLRDEEKVAPLVHCDEVEASADGGPIQEHTFEGRVEGWPE